MCQTEWKCSECVFCVMCGAEWNVDSMWNEWIVGDMCNGVQFHFPLATPPLSFKTKRYILCFGKIVFVDLR